MTEAAAAAAADDDGLGPVDREALERAVSLVLAVLRPGFETRG
jgi:hypothetical protein